MYIFRIMVASTHPDIGIGQDSRSWSLQLYVMTSNITCLSTSHASVDIIGLCRYNFQEIKFPHPYLGATGGNQIVLVFWRLCYSYS
jgi:hypothetical protein